MKILNKVTLLAWFFLLLAIVAEVIGTSFLKAENIFYALFMMSIFIAISYYFMGKAITKIQVGIAYAVWELLGAVLIILVAFFIFGERLSTTQMLGLALAFIGIIMINLGEAKH
ncbi:SMR family transporter [uncultured Campylobacter sp.]|uniref:DMT family transporter n=1 Tax=uncultured Campylobacter sp. TaxID=218934 RepID=UPI002602CE6B|nr:SMR family transporter [uncultured Campylobacter sp.]